MLDRYRSRHPAPAAPEGQKTTGAEKTAMGRAAPAAPAAPAEISTNAEALALRAEKADERLGALASLYFLPGQPGQPGQPITARVPAAPVVEVLPGQAGATATFRAWRIRFTNGDRCTAVHPFPVSADLARADALEQFGAGVGGIEPATSNLGEPAP